MYRGKKQTERLIFAAWLVYAAATLGRLSYSAAMVKIISELSISNSQAGAVLTAFAIVYGTGQLVNGILCRFYNCTIVVPAVMTVSAAVTIALPFTASPALMAVLWAVNGAAQSVLWSLIIRTLSLYVRKESIGHAVVVISTTTAVGTTAAYALSAIFVAVDAWRLTFIIAGVLCVASGIVWAELLSKLGKPAKQTAMAVTGKKNKPSLGRYFLAMFVFMCFAAFFNGFVRDGVNSWMPKLISESFGVNESLSIILTLILPLFSVFGAVMARKTYFLIKNQGILLLLFFGLASTVLYIEYIIFPFKLLIATVVIFVLVACSMAAVNNVVASIFPLDNRDYFDSGLSAGILDTMCYVGSSVAGSLIGFTSEAHGWRAVILVLAAFSALCSLISAMFSFVRSKEHI